MLRVGLTGNLGSGKSTVASLFEKRGAHVLQSDAIGRELMQPGKPVFDAIVALFGPGVLQPDGTLDRPALARIAFAEGHAKELNAIVHPAVIARQGELAEAIEAQNPSAVLLVESALLFDPKHPSRDPRAGRFARILLVTASEDDKLERFLRRTGSAADRPEVRKAEARRRLALQVSDEVAVPLADHVIRNDGSLGGLERQVEALWPILADAARVPELLQDSTESLQ
ncbi:dephospho-CoA kinase [Granulicella sibirica]|uniref:Dephospho-CoA kinase n=1 Tax=Granulicella sibirica TaxID=2479048 RepID=A0A4Q0T538_9BACT|nr:dephospho-CoA kinase [Granulicella sibirica]RXH57720.1 Dephospho-CoA kinase [Granulicella sibirica]